MSGWVVSEANSITAWMFQHLGLVDGLHVDRLITVCALWVLYRTQRVPSGAKSAFITVVFVGTGLTVLNNLGAIERLGLSVVPGALAF